MLCTGSSDNARSNYTIITEGNPYPQTLAITSQEGPLRIQKHGFTGPLGQIVSLKYSVSKDTERLFTVIDGGFSNMPRVALKIDNCEIAVFNYGLKRLEMKCEETLSGYGISGNYLTAGYEVVDSEGIMVSSVTAEQRGRQSIITVTVRDQNQLAAALGIPVAIALLRSRVEEHLEEQVGDMPGR